MVLPKNLKRWRQSLAFLLSKLTLKVSVKEDKVPVKHKAIFILYSPLRWNVSILSPMYPKVLPPLMPNKYTIKKMISF